MLTHHWIHVFIMVTHQNLMQHGREVVGRQLANNMHLKVKVGPITVSRWGSNTLVRANSGANMDNTWVSRMPMKANAGRTTDSKWVSSMPVKTPDRRAFY